MFAGHYKETPHVISVHTDDVVHTETHVGYGTVTPELYALITEHQVTPEQHGKIVSFIPELTRPFIPSFLKVEDMVRKTIQQYLVDGVYQEPEDMDMFHVLNAQV